MGKTSRLFVTSMLPSISAFALHIVLRYEQDLTLCLMWDLKGKALILGVWGTMWVVEDRSLGLAYEGGG